MAIAGLYQKMWVKTKIAIPGLGWGKSRTTAAWCCLQKKRGFCRLKEGMPTRGQVVQWTVIALLALAVLMVNSAGLAAGEAVTWADLLHSRPMLYALLAVGVMWVFSYLPIDAVYRMRGVLSPFPMLLVFALILCALPLLEIGPEINGSRRWLALGPAEWGLTFQPSELAKWVTVGVLAWWCARRAGAMRRWWAGLVPVALALGLLCGMIAKEDFGTAALIGLVGVVMLVAGGIRWWHAGLLTGSGLALAAGMIVIEPYRVRRLTAFINPFADAQDTGLQAVQMMAAIAEGNRGLGNGIVKQGYLPVDTSDAIYAIIVEELGLAGAAGIVLLFLLLLWTAGGIVRDARSPFNRLLGLGVLLTIGLQAALNLAVVTVVVPTKGIALPFVSAGGTGWVLGAMAVGVLAAIDRQTRRDWQALADSQPAGDVEPDAEFETNGHPRPTLHAGPGSDHQSSDGAARPGLSVSAAGFAS